MAASYRGCRQPGATGAVSGPARLRRGPPLQPPLLGGRHAMALGQYRADEPGLRQPFVSAGRGPVPELLAVPLSTAVARARTVRRPGRPCPGGPVDHPGAV